MNNVHKIIIFYITFFFVLMLALLYFFNVEAQVEAFTAVLDGLDLVNDGYYQHLETYNSGCVFKFMDSFNVPFYAVTCTDSIIPPPYVK